MAKIGRNELCICGSGLKFKKCCQNNFSENSIAASKQMLKERSKNLFTSLSGEEPIYFEDLMGVRKMSEVLLEFAEPLINKTDGSIEKIKKVFAVATIAWNIAVVGDVDIQLEELRQKYAADDNQFADDLILITKSLVKRKLELFSDVRRLISDFDLIVSEDGFHLNVVSNPLKDDADIGKFERAAMETHP